MEYPVDIHRLFLNSLQNYKIMWDSSPIFPNTLLEMA